MTLTKGTLVPNWSLVLSDGRTCAAWDWRQRSNLLLIVAPRSSSEERQRWQAGIEAERKQWIWLHAEVVIVTEPAEDLSEGVHAIDRYGRWIRSWPLDQWTFEDLQREYIYYEARHC
jgi:hypothetical protein